MSKLYGLIPAAGKGTRAYPYTHHTPKGLLPVNGVSNIERSIRIMRDSLGIEQVCIVTGHHGDMIRERFGDGSDLGVAISYVHNDAIDRGLAYSVLLAREVIDDYFCVMLSDECYIDTNHHELATFPYRDALATCGVLETDDTALIARNYSVETDGAYVTRLIEKPTRIVNNLLGSGTFIFDPRLFEHLERAFAEAGAGPVDLVSHLDVLRERGEKVLHFRIQGDYVNINDRDSLQHAKYLVRERLLDSLRICLLVYCEGDEPDIAFTIEEYRRQSRIRDIAVIVPHENSIEAEVYAAGAAILRCPPEVTLYGEKIRYALEMMTADVVIITEANYSFHQRDVGKLLAYLPEADMVIGTRTTRQLIDQGSRMRGVVRLANIFLAKLIEVLWWGHECRFTDVGCTFRAVWRTSYDIVKDNLRSPGPEFSAEMMIELIEARERVIEIPVSYYTRSYSQYRKYQNVRTFLRMLGLIVGRRLRDLRFLGSR
jgi:NDP-sugar pyrophosphorylase family protein